MGSQRRGTGEDRRFQCEQSGPGTLDPPQRARVVDAYPRVDDGPQPAAHESLEVVVVQAGRQHLPPRDHAVLEPQHGVDARGSHAVSLPVAIRAYLRLGGRVDRGGEPAGDVDGTGRRILIARTW